MGKGSGGCERNAIDWVEPPVRQRPAPTKGVRYDAGRMMFQRIGTLNAVKQQAVTFDKDEDGFSSGLLKTGPRNPRAPERHGIWAFPYPYFDGYFASFQYSLSMPKHFTTRRKELNQAFANTSYEERQTLHAQIDVLEAEIKAWIKTPAGKAALGIKKFWASGYVYTHLDANKTLVNGEWQLVSMGEFYELLKKQYAMDCGWVTKGSGQRYGWQAGKWPCSVDHLEVFLPASAQLS